MGPAWRGARSVLRRLRGLTVLLPLPLLLLCPRAARSDCSLPPDVPNAHPDWELPTSFPAGSIVTYKCNENFVKVPGGQDTVTCLQNNEWSRIEEFCNRSCDVPKPLSFAVLKQPYIRQNYFPVGSVMEYECRKSFKRIHSLSGEVTCLQNFTWSKLDEFCEKKSCPNPGEITNGHVNIITDILFGASIIFSCNAGYKLVGATSSYCIVVGTTVDWSDPLPECKENSPTSKVTQTPEKPTAANILGTEAPSTPQKPTTVNIPATEPPSTPQKPITVNVPATKAPLIPQKPTTVNISTTEALSTPQKPITVNVPATKAPLIPQKPTTVNISATEALSTPQKPITVNVSATKAPLIPQKPTTVNIPATESPSTPQKPITVNVPATKAPLIPQKPTTVNISATEASSTPQKPFTVNVSATKSPLIPQKPTTVNVAATKASSTPRKTITANDSATIAKPPPESNILSTETLPAPQTPIIANTSAVRVTVTQKFTAVHDPVTKGRHTTQTSAHITATQNGAVTTRKMTSHSRNTSVHSRTTSAGVSTIASGLVAGTVIIGALILVKIFWDYGKSGSYYTQEDSKAENVMFHNVIVTPDTSEVRPSGK